jgi:hypothetical protein
MRAKWLAHGSNALINIVSDGLAYVELFGMSRLLSAPAAIVERLDDNHMYLQLTDDLRRAGASPDLLNNRRRSVKEHLGIEVFFDSDHKYYWRKAGPVGSVFRVPNFDKGPGRD